ncbi:MAG: sulfite exporter TauE/SafE family protein [Deltaproteobacteria bacterium]|nr:sulfite exporter TauE/SafE family protein [Deltaproteobacteria bacterium]
MEGSGQLGLFFAFGMGILSVLSPCVLPLLPSYLSYITGISFDDLHLKKKRILFLSVFHSLLFILGFSCMFVLLGAAASAVGQALRQYQDIFTRVGGLVIIILGLHLTGLLKFTFLEKQKYFKLEDRPLGFLGSFVVGVVFAAAWTPCVGPVLGSILTLSASQEDFWQGIYLLCAYSLGFAVPFLVLSFSFNFFLVHFTRIKRHLKWATFVSGVLLILLGFGLFTNYFSSFTAYLAGFRNFFD